MSNPPTTNMGLVMPTEGSDDGTWDALINDAADVLDGHTHAPGLGVRVPTAGLRINADLSMADAGVYSAIVDAKALEMQPHAAAGMSAYAGAFFVNSSDSNNLYFRTVSGSNVRITNGAQLDFTVAGGIGGDYVAAGAAVAYTSASDSYTFKKPSPGNWARLQAGALRISEYNTTESTYVELACPAALAGTYTITFPTAAPGSTSLVQMSSAGVLTASTTVTSATTFSGLITASVGATATAGQSFTVSGAGEYKHGDRTMVIRALSGTLGNGTSGVSGGAGPYFILGGNAGDIWLVDIPLRAGKRIRSLQWYYQRAGGTLTFDLRKSVLSTGVESSIASTTSAAGTTYTSISQAAIDYTLLAAESYYLRLTFGALNDRLYDIVVTYDHP